jgi:hypothetical protein
MNVDADSLRAVVREILVELLDGPGQRLGASEMPPSGLGQRIPEADDVAAVRISDDADLQNFALHVLRLAEDPVRREALRTGQIRFRLLRADDAPGQPGSLDATTLRISRGALTEKAVTEAARCGRSILLAKGAVATPLALDKARSLGVTVHKEAA